MTFMLSTSRQSKLHGESYQMICEGFWSRLERECHCSERFTCNQSRMLFRLGSRTSATALAWRVLGEAEKRFRKLQVSWASY